MIVQANLGSPVDWLIIAAVVLVLFGGKKIPEMMRGIGEGMKEFKKATREDPPTPAETPMTAASSPPAPHAAPMTSSESVAASTAAPSPAGEASHAASEPVAAAPRPQEPA